MSSGAPNLNTSYQPKPQYINANNDTNNPPLLNMPLQANSSLMAPLSKSGQMVNPVIPFHDNQPIHQDLSAHLDHTHLVSLAHPQGGGGGGGGVMSASSAVKPSYRDPT